MTMYLIACSSTKLNHAAPARDLYISDLFRKSVAYAEAQGAEWAILSALHGVVMPETVIAPYDVTLSTMSAQEREVWGCMAADELWPFDGPFVFLAGANYRQPMIESQIWRARGYSAIAPMEGMGIGQQKAWLLQHTAGRLAA